MAFEIEYIPVGDGDKSGDAIVLRYGNLIGSRDEQIIIVIDGGFEPSGEEVVSHIQKFYGTNVIDLVISTHPDMDHIAGLCIILEKMTVNALLMHKPWDHAEYIKEAFKKGDITTAGLKKRIEKSLQHASNLESIALKKGVPIIEPFQGVRGYSDTLHVLGPSKEYYEDLLPHFREMPDTLEALEKIFAPVKEAVQSAVEWVEDHIGVDLIDNDEDKTSPENNTSTVILFEIEGHKLLLTGDAGKTALLNSAEYAKSLGILLTDLNFFDVPHHGSKRNLSTKVLNEIHAETAFISASKNSTKHPAKKITNALKKKNIAVYVNRRGTLRHHRNAPDRPNWVSAIEEPFHDKVED